MTQKEKNIQSQDNLWTIVRLLLELATLIVLVSYDIAPDKDAVPNVAYVLLGLFGGVDIYSYYVRKK